MVEGLLGGAREALFPTQVPAGASYDLDSMRMARAALLGNLGASLIAAGQGGQSPESRAAHLGRMGMGIGQAADIQAQGVASRLRGEQIKEMQAERARKAAEDAFFRNSIAGLPGVGAVGGSGLPVAAPTAAPVASSPPAGAATPIDPAAVPPVAAPPPASSAEVAARVSAPPPVTDPTAVTAAVRPGGKMTWWQQLGIQPALAVQIANLPSEQRRQVMTKLILDQATPRETWKTVQLNDGTVVQMNSRSGKIEKALDPSGAGKEMASAENTLRTEFLGNEAVKTYNQAQRAYLSMTDMVTRANSGRPGAGVSDTALVFAFFKTIDPISVVRESEFGRAAEAMGLSERAIAELSRLKGTGFLSPEVRSELANVGEIYLEKQYEDVDRLGGNYRDLATRRKLNADNVILDPRAPSVRQRYEAVKISPEKIEQLSLKEITALPIDRFSTDQLLAVQRRKRMLMTPQGGR